MSPSPPLAVALDLDGTLVDSAPDLADAANALLARLGAAPLPAAALTTMLGDGVDVLVERVVDAAFGGAASRPDLDPCIDAFVGIYREALFVRSRVYAGVVAGLAALEAGGVPLCCVTNKRATLTRPLLAEAGLAGYFDLVLCADSAARKKPSPAMLLEASEHLGIDPAALVMVGDAVQDVQAARAAGCRALAVSYGYGERDRLLAAGAERLIDSLLDIGAIASAANLAHGE